VTAIPTQLADDERYIVFSNDQVGPVRPEALAAKLSVRALSEGDATVAVQLLGRSAHA
jgi:hypothetical protein